MRIKTQVCFSATNLPHYQSLKTQHIKIITSMCQMTLQDSSDHFYPPTGHVWPWDFVQPWDLVQAWYYCPYFMKIATETQFQFTNNNHWWFEAKWVWAPMRFPPQYVPGIDVQPWDLRLGLVPLLQKFLIMKTFVPNSSKYSKLVHPRHH